MDKNNNNQNSIESVEQAQHESSIKNDMPINANKLYPENRKLLISMLCLLIVVGSISGFVVYKEHTKSQENLDRSRIIALASSNNCTDKALQSVASEKPNLKQFDTSGLLLNYRATCFTQRGKYQLAINNFKQLRIYYATKHDAQDQSEVSLIDEAITIDQYKLAHRQ